MTPVLIALLFTVQLAFRHRGFKGTTPFYHGATRGIFLTGVWSIWGIWSLWGVADASAQIGASTQTGASARGGGAAGALGEEKNSLLKLYYSSFTRDPNVLENISAPETLALEDAIADTAYTVGPGDAFEVAVYGVSPPLVISATVSPEGTLSVRALGAFAASGRKLSAVKKEVAEKVAQQYRSLPFSVQLSKPRSFAVSVVGAVRSPGRKTVSSTDRVDRAVIAATVQLGSSPTDASKKAQRLGYERLYPDLTDDVRPSLRGIELRRKTGETVEVDLLRYFLTGETRYNPFLQEGDIIQVPSLSPEAATQVGIYGAVQIPGLYEYVRHDSVSSLIKMAQGLRKDADASRVQLVRATSRTGVVGFETMVIDVNAILLKQRPDIAVLPDDRLQVPVKSIRALGNVTVRGEVQYPGFYAVEPRKTTLKEVVRLAGGFKPEALLSKSRVFRRPTSDDQAGKQIEGVGDPDFFKALVARTSNLDPEEFGSFDFEYNVRRNYVSVDFRQLFAAGSAADLVLEDGDIISIPRDEGTIYILGQVGSPGYIRYVAGQDHRYYLAQAGGETGESTGDVKILKAGSYQWKRPGETAVESGDWIFVPKKVRKTFGQTIAEIAPVISLVTAIASLGFLIYQVTR